METPTNYIRHHIRVRDTRIGDPCVQSLHPFLETCGGYPKTTPGNGRYGASTMISHQQRHQWSFYHLKLAQFNLGSPPTSLSPYHALFNPTCLFGYLLCTPLLCDTKISPRSTSSSPPPPPPTMETSTEDDYISSTTTSTTTKAYTFSFCWFSQSDGIIGANHYTSTHSPVRFILYARV
uniref:Uncharacterized protein n=1 Tax=Moniliophthora roreri TaxID=221103 RepID=A0A0W0F0D5_MONRR